MAVARKILIRVLVYAYSRGKAEGYGRNAGQRVVDALPFLDTIAEVVQPKVGEAVEAGGTTARNVLDGVWFGGRYTRRSQTSP